MNEIEELIKTYKKDIDNLTKSMGFSSLLNETRKRELLICLEFGITTLQRISTDPVEVPKFIKNTMQQYNSLQDMLTEEYYSNYTSEMDSDAVSCWIDTNFDLLCRAWLDGCTAAKEPRWVVAVEGEEAFSGFLDLDGQGEMMKATFSNSKAVEFVDEAKAEAVALLIGGEVVPVEEGE